MSNHGIDGSNLSAKLLHSIDVLWKDREISDQMKDFFNHIRPEMLPFWEKYYSNLETAMQSVNHMNEVIAESAKKAPCPQSSFESKPTSLEGLKQVQSGKGALTLKNGTVIFGADTITAAGKGVSTGEAKREAGSFGIIGLLKPCTASGK